ncbi:MAG: sapC family protein [Ramlibacter sp.]|uniref:SapC family protein n=1 Tax=Ramlibacter sp. TaxID=1917967 RepID=UPI0026072E96|nr:SapC family protein [Ramlibacter sp.]MDB5751962.1 sapC family protein [Ramlibacter sp.]
MRLAQFGLLSEMNAPADLLDGRSFTVGSVYVVDEKKLTALSDCAVRTLFRAGELHLVSMHLVSLSSMQALMERIAARTAAMQPAPLPPPA